MIDGVWLWAAAATVTVLMIFYLSFRFKILAIGLSLMTMVIFYLFYIGLSYHPEKELREVVEALLSTREGTEILIQRIEDSKKDQRYVKEADRLLTILRGQRR